jgi:alpha-1,6-mannosyltransferase
MQAINRRYLAFDASHLPRRNVLYCINTTCFLFFFFCILLSTLAYLREASQATMPISYIQVSLDAALVLSTFAAALLAPYTKVEESFNVQAVHDIINVGLDRIELFDHVTFPGAVKRSSLGALFLSLPSIFIPGTTQRWSGIIVEVAVFLHSILPTSLGSLYPSANDLREVLLDTKVSQLIFTRCFLALLTCFSMTYLRRSITYSCSKTSKLIGIWFSLLYYPLPHIIFYSSRFLPNFVCFPLVNIALGMFISGDITRSISVLVFTGIIFRFELLVFTAILIFFCVSGILRNGSPILSIREGIICTTIAALFGSFLATRIDSFFWDVTFTIPELESFAFNVIDNGSTAWGVEPWYAYLTNYIPKLFASQLFLTPLLTIIFLALSTLNVKNVFIKNYKHKPYRIDYVNFGVGTLTTLAWTAVTYLAVLSINGHKEWRFALYTIPVFCAVAASTFEWVLEKLRGFLTIQRLLVAIITLSYVISMGASVIFALVSSWNYAGGDAVQRLNSRILNDYREGGMLKPLVVHWDVGTCMNGASLFTQVGDNKLMRNAWLQVDDGDNENEGKYWVVYDKTEDEDSLIDVASEANFWVQYDSEPLIESSNIDDEWLLVDVVEGVTGVNVNYAMALVKDPVTIARYMVEGRWEWFANAFDRCLKKSVRGRVYERTKKLWA